jgi:hypothetical protein
LTARGVISSSAFDAMLQEIEELSDRSWGEVVDALCNKIAQREASEESERYDADADAFICGSDGR